MAIDGDVRFSSFPGSSQLERSKDRTLVNACTYTVTRPTDTAPGSRRIGIRTHKPVRVTCGIDKAAPEVWKHLCLGKKIDEIEVRLWHANVEGIEVNYMTFKMLNARVIGCQFTQLHNLQSNAAEMATEPMVEYAFTFEKIILTYDDGTGAVEADDDWLNPAT